MKKHTLFCLITCFASSVLFGAGETQKKEPKTTHQVSFHDTLVKKKHTLQLEEDAINYESCTGFLPVKNSDNKQKAEIFFTAYFAKDTDKNRPITFCFNGGPGSSSIWLHIGCMGPKKLILSSSLTPPGKYENNPHSILQTSDLVFVDPVSTGFSKAAQGVEAKEFHGVEGDVQLLSLFIYQFIAAFNKWSSPLFLAGESYGTTRVVALAEKLFSDWDIATNGLILISSFLDMSLHNQNNDIHYGLVLPTYTATAHYHKKLTAELLEKPLKEVLQEVEHFVSCEFIPGLFVGDKLPPERKEKIIEKLSLYTGLNQKLIESYNMRIPSMFFAKELLREEQKVVGRFDARVTGRDSCPFLSYAQDDPSTSLYSPLFSSAYHTLLVKELGWTKTDFYHLLNGQVHPWNWKYKCPYRGDSLNVRETLGDLLITMPHLKVFAAMGYHDCATPYFDQEYSFNHISSEKEVAEQVEKHYFEGGHMMYLQEDVLESLNKEMNSFIQKYDNQSKEPSKTVS